MDEQFENKLKGLPDAARKASKKIGETLFTTDSDWKMINIGEKNAKGKKGNSKRVLILIVT